MKDEHPVANKGSTPLLKMSCVTLFPEMFQAITEYGVSARAIKRGLAEVSLVNPRDFTTDKHRTVDDRPYGGGPGMLMMVEPLTKAIQHARQECTSIGIKESDGNDTSAKKAHVVYLSPQGRPVNQAIIEELIAHKHLVFVSGRYEGIDERIIEQHVDDEISLADIVLSGGELATMAVMDAMIRTLPEALGHKDSADQDSFADGLLDCPHYTRPEDLNGLCVPAVLLSGHHGDIKRWRMKQSLGRTWLRRPDLLKTADLTDEQRKLLAEFQHENE